MTVCTAAEPGTPGENHENPSYCTWLWLPCVRGGRVVGPWRGLGWRRGQEEVPEQVRPLFPPATLLPLVQSPEALLCAVPSPLLLGIREMLQSSCPRRSRNTYTMCSPPSRPRAVPRPPHPPALGPGGTEVPGTRDWRRFVNDRC